MRPVRVKTIEKHLENSSSRMRVSTLRKIYVFVLFLSVFNGFLLLKRVCLNMDVDKLKYYLAGILFIVIALVCMLSAVEQTGNSRILIFDVVAIAVCLPLGISALRKARKRKYTDES